MMKSLDVCRHGAPANAYSDSDEMALAARLMAEIGAFSHERKASPCPLCLRDTLLTVAALLHLEGVKLRSEGAKGGKSGFRAKTEFARAARDRLDAAADAESILPLRHRH